MKKNYLFTPGPAMVPHDVTAAEAREIIHHRTPQFMRIFSNACANLKKFFRTENDIAVFSSSGTGAMEAAVANVASRGDKVIVVRSGKFGERWQELCLCYGLDVVALEAPYGETVKLHVIEAAIAANRDAKAIFATLSETSTGVVYDVEAISSVAKKAGLLVIVDAISGAGVVPLEVDKWGIDVAVTGSQKGLMMPPGLACATISPGALAAARASNQPRYYFSFTKMKKALDENTGTAFTPAISLVYALDAALERIVAEGMENVWRRHARLGRACRQAVRALGLELFAGENAGNVLTSVMVPAGIDGGRLVKMLRDEHGTTVAGGQGEMKGRIFRIGHMGYIDDFDLLVMLGSLEKALRRLDYGFEPGVALRAAQEVFLAD